MELIDQIPFGLIACELNGEQVTVTGISADLLRLRLAEPVEVRSLTLHFLRFREALEHTCPGALARPFL